MLKEKVGADEHFNVVQKVILEEEKKRFNLLKSRVPVEVREQGCKQ